MNPPNEPKTAAKGPICGTKIDRNNGSINIPKFKAQISFILSVSFLPVATTNICCL